jgi:class 3 adenylate cyclase
MKQNSKSYCLILLLIAGYLLFSHSLPAQENYQAKADSLLLWISTANEDTGKVNLYAELFISYFKFDPEEGLKYEKPALELAQSLNWKSGIARIHNLVGRAYWRLGKFEEALKHHFNALLLYTDAKDEINSARCLVYIGQDYADGGKYAQALIFFNKALVKNKAIGNKREIADTYMLLSWVHDNLGNYTESSKLNYAVLKLVEEMEDRYGIAVATSNIAETNYKLGNYPEALKYYDKAVKALQASNDQVNTIGCYLSIGKIHLITGNYPEAVKNYSLALQLSDKINDRFGRAMAYGGLGEVFQAQNDYSEALKNYIIGAEQFRAVSNKQELSRIYSEMGICYSRLKKYSDAKKCFEEALVLSKELGSTVSFTDYYQGKEILDSATGNWEQAYKNHKQYIALRDSTFNKENIKKMVSSQLQYESEKKEAAANAEREKKEAVAKAEQEKKDIRQRTIRNSITATLAGTLLFLIVVYRQRNKISRARKRSDELLLNILPEEVAEELKSKGKAEAKHFDETTVMFTDFKGFTQISEKLSPAELVAEIDTCFKAFDGIITKHNIEKIKTIGDAYMCAGGLPIPNKSHAADVVSAAIEIQKFMEAHLLQRKNEGKELFEIRIGIHTGPVVAGIVGVKKFAYDIWGDTVNIASRMESSGEAGKVNISGSTYELVKDKFRCVHRGKIQAKNKGEIDMYFVEYAS